MYVCVAISYIPQAPEAELTPSHITLSRDSMYHAASGSRQCNDHVRQAPNSFKCKYQIPKSVNDSMYLICQIPKSVSGSMYPSTTILKA